MARKPPDPDARTAAAERADRLAGALRANLHRRKAQVRARRDGAEDEAGLDAGPDDPGDGDAG